MSIYHGAKLGTTKAMGITWGGIKAKGISEILVLREGGLPVAQAIASDINFSFL